MHIPDGVLTGPVLGTTGALAAAGVGVGLYRMRYEEIPRVGVLSSVFFVASLIRVPIGPSSAHLLLIGMMGYILGWAVFPAMAVALLLQAIQFGFGGFVSLGANLLNMATPGVACYYLFARFTRPNTAPATVFRLGFAAGVTGIVLACIMCGTTLFASGKEFVAAIIALSIGHIPVMVIEGFVTGFILAFLQKVRPEMFKKPVIGS
ncbi:MAG: cobalt transporter CbiM [Armatimonadota bacterium]